MARMRGLFLCSGIGGMELAAEATGLIDVIGQVEIDDFCTSVLAHHWPDVPRMRDLKEVRGDEFGTVDLVVAGFPCQPTSHAGKRRGASDDRWLWPDVYGVIRCARPAWILLENVPGLITLGLDTVLSDLASAGYEAAACVYPASAVGAPHQRERVFIVGHLADADSQWQQQSHRRITHQRRWAGNYCEDVANTNQHSGRWAQRAKCRDMDGAAGADTSREGHTQWATAECRSADVADTAGARLPKRRQARQSTREAQARTRLESESERRGWPVVNACGTGQQERHPARVASDTGHATGRLTEAGQQRQIESGMGVATNGIPGRLAGHPGWPSGPGQAQHEWEAPRTVPASDRTPQRDAKLKALGNAVIPAQVLPILAAIAETWLAEAEH